MTQSNNAGAQKSKRPWTAVARFLMGLAFFVFGLNGFLHFIPQPKTMPEGAMAFFGALMNTRYMLPLIFGTQTLAGALLLLNCFVPLALAFLAPVIVNIMLFHIFIAPSGIPMACIVLVLELFLAWSYRRAFMPLLALRG
jgi:hypothetical protein